MPVIALRRMRAARDRWQRSLLFLVANARAKRAKGVTVVSDGLYSFRNDGKAGNQEAELMAWRCAHRPSWSAAFSQRFTRYTSRTSRSGT
jgi:hypothetical protein